MLRAAGADLVLLLAVLHPARRLARLVRRAQRARARAARRGRTTTASLSGRSRPTPGSSGSTTGTCGRWRSTSSGPAACATSCPDDRLVIAESGVRDPSIMARWRALGFDAALVGEALMRAADPAAGVAAVRRRGRGPRRSRQRRAPAARQDLRRHGRRGRPGRGASRGRCHRAQRGGRARPAPSVSTRPPRWLVSSGRRRPRVPDRRRRGDHRRRQPRPARRRSWPRIDPDVVQLSGSESVPAAARRRAADLEGAPCSARRAPAAPCHPRRSRPTWSSRGHAYLAGRRRAPPARYGRRAAPGRDRAARLRARGRRGRPRAAGHAGRRAEPGQRRRTRCGRSPPSASTSPRASSGRAAARTARRVADEGPAARRAVRQACRAPPATTARTSRSARRRSTPASSTPTARGRWGMERDFGGRYVPETLMAALEQLETAYDAAPPGPRLLGRAARAPRRASPGVRPPSTAPTGSPMRSVARPVASAAGTTPAPAIPALRLYLKREDLAHTGAHKINNALGQALLTRRLGKTRVIAETGAGQHGVATATACALLDLPCVVYMGAEDIERQGPNVLRMRALGAEVRSVTSGTATLKDAVNEAMRDWVTNVADDPLRPGLGDGPAPVSDDRPRPPATDRRRGGGAAARRRGPPAGPRARLRRRRLERDRTAGPVHRRAGGPARRRRGRR